jgi:hypothetical protein
VIFRKFTKWSGIWYFFAFSKFTNVNKIFYLHSMRCASEKANTLLMCFWQIFLLAFFVCGVINDSFCMNDKSSTYWLKYVCWVSIVEGLWSLSSNDGTPPSLVRLPSITLDSSIWQSYPENLQNAMVPTSVCNNARKWTQCLPSCTREVGMSISNSNSVGVP